MIAEEIRRSDAPQDVLLSTKADGSLSFVLPLSASPEVISFAHDKHLSVMIE